MEENEVRDCLHGDSRNPVNVDGNIVTVFVHGLTDPERVQNGRHGNKEAIFARIPSRADPGVEEVESYHEDAVPDDD